MLKFLSTTFKLGLGAVAALILVEASLHVIASTPAGKVLPVIEPQLGQLDNDIGFAFKPNKTALWTRENRAFVSINALGLRGKETTQQKPKNTYRVAVSGDSRVEALQVEDEYIFTSIAEKKLREDGRNIEIMNFAMSGNGPLRQLVRLEKFATPLSPDLTIMLMSAGDFMSGELRDDSGNPGYTIKDNSQAERSYSYKNRFSQRHADTLLGQKFMFLMHNSNIFRMLYLKKEEAPLKILGLNLGRAKSANTAQDECKTGAIKNLFSFWSKQTKSPDWIATNHYFAELSQYTKTTPTILGAYIPLIPAQCTLQNNQRLKIIEEMRELSAKNNVIFIDWNNQVSKHLPNKRTIDTIYGFGTSLGHGHLNYDGHTAYAKVLSETIKKNQDR